MENDSTPHTQCPSIRDRRWSPIIGHYGSRPVPDGVSMATRIKMIEVVVREGVNNVVIVPTEGKPKFAFKSAHRDQALNVAKAYARQYGVLIHYSTDTKAFPDSKPIGDDPDETDPIVEG